MGFWNDGLSSSRPRSRSRSRSRSRDRHHHSSSTSKHSTSKPTYNRASSSFFGLPNTSTASHHSGASTSKRYYVNSSSSSSRAQPRRNFTNQLMSRLRRFIRDLYYYMRRHPFKVFVLVIMPLITGGVLTKILAQFGVRLPKGLERLVGGRGGIGGAGGYQKERYYARGGARDFGGGSSLPGMGGGMGDNLVGLLKVAKMFM